MPDAVSDATKLTIVLLFGLSGMLYAQSPTADEASWSSPLPGKIARAHMAATDAGVDLLRSFAPHPYLFVGPTLMGAGYAPFTSRIEAGLDMESKRAVITAGAAYDGGHQVNDGVQSNPKGHDRYLAAALIYGLRGFFQNELLSDSDGGGMNSRQRGTPKEQTVRSSVLAMIMFTCLVEAAIATSRYGS